MTGQRLEVPVRKEWLTSDLLIGSCAGKSSSMSAFAGGVEKAAVPVASFAGWRHPPVTDEMLSR
jgi:hypothetical protein